MQHKFFPRRLANLRAYAASYLYSATKRPPVGEMLHWIFQPGKETRAEKFIQSREEFDGMIRVRFVGYENDFYYPSEASWIDFCQTVDETFNPKNWHYFVSERTPVTREDIVVDCGAAEGLFSYMVAQSAGRVHAFEPIPSWHRALRKTFQESPNVEIHPVGVGHRSATMRMTDDEIYSRISEEGTLEIDIVTIDSVFADKGLPITFLKADIEGFEFQMLLGAEETIRKNRPKISITTYHGPNHFQQIRDFLSGIHPDYRFQTRGIVENGNPVLTQAY